MNIRALITPALAAAFAFGITVSPANAGPIDFLKRVGNSIAHGGKKPVSHKPTRKAASRSNDNAARSPAPAETPPASSTADVTPVDSPAPRPSITPAPSPVATPTPATRVAASVPPTARSKADLPYGVPVPNRPGFVTSPYSPQGGLVDIRGLPSGIEVKDPYTGKIFLTP